MKTLQGNTIKAYRILTKLADAKMPFNATYKLFKLRNLLQVHWDMQLEEEKKLMKDFECNVDDDGNIVMKNIEDKEKFLNQLVDFSKNEVELDVEPIHINAEGLDINLTMVELMDLDPFVVFD